MRIQSARRFQLEPSPRGFNTIDKFGLQVTDDIAVFDLSLVQAPDGRLFVYGPASKSGADTRSLSPTARALVIDMALAALGMETNDQIQH